MSERLVLHVGDQAARVEVVELHRRQPRAQQTASVLGRDRPDPTVRVVCPAGGALAGIALAQEAAHHRHHPLGVGTPRASRAPDAGPGRWRGIGIRRDHENGLPASCRTREARGMSARGRIRDQRARGQRDRRVCPLRRAALRTTRCDAAGAHVREELLRRRGMGRLRVGAPDVYARVVVGTADADRVARGDICGGRTVQLGCAGAVADLPHAEQLRQAPAVARGQRSADHVVGMGQSAGDVALVHVSSAQLHVAGIGLQPVVVVGGDVVAEHVHRHRGLAAKVGGELLGDEHVGTVGDLHDAVDRVVIGDRDEVHAPPSGELVDLLGGRGALRQSGGALHAELRYLRGGRVAVHVHPADLLARGTYGGRC